MGASYPGDRSQSISALANGVPVRIDISDNLTVTNSNYSILDKSGNT